jgi:hypothetical protein
MACQRRRNNIDGQGADGKAGKRILPMMMVVETSWASSRRLLVCSRMGRERTVAHESLTLR